MTALETLLALAPCYTASERITGLISMAEAETSQTAYGAFRAKAVALLALHWLALSARGKGAAAGPITSEAEGDLSRSYAAPAATPGGADSLASTSWGQELQRLRRGCFLGHRTRMG